MILFVNQKNTLQLVYVTTDSIKLLQIILNSKFNLIFQTTFLYSWWYKIIKSLVYYSNFKWLTCFYKTKAICFFYSLFLCNWIWFDVNWIYIHDPGIAEIEYTQSSKFFNEFKKKCFTKYKTSYLYFLFSLYII